MDETGWLIEHKDTSLGSVVWPVINENLCYWSSDSNHAIHFSRKEDAEAMMGYLRLDRVAHTATEHMWYNK